MDDCYSFEKLLEEVKKEAEDESKVMELLESKIVAAFANKVRQDAIDDNRCFSKEEKIADNNYNHLLDHTFVPKRKRSSLLQYSQGNTSSSQEVVEDGRKIEKRVSRKPCFASEISTEEEEEKKVRIIKKVNIIKKPKKVENVNFESLGLLPPPPMPNEWKTRIDKVDGRNIKLVIMKKMFSTDISKRHDRLSIPLKQIIDNSFLFDSEKKELNLHQKPLSVKLMEPCGSDSQLVLRQWNLKSSSIYALTTSWNSVLDRNFPKEIKEDDIIQLWSFRVNRDQLWLTLIKVWDAPCDDDNIAAGTSGSGSCSGNEDGAGTSHNSTVRFF